VVDTFRPDGPDELSERQPFLRPHQHGPPGPWVGERGFCLDAAPTLALAHRTNLPIAIISEGYLDPAIGKPIGVVLSGRYYEELLRRATLRDTDYYL
jgi:hypothetical protein